MTLLEKIQQALRSNPLQVNGRALPLKWRFSVHLPATGTTTDAQTEVQAAIGKLGLEAVVAVHATVKPSPVSLDKALALIARGQGEQVSAHLPQLLQEIIPLLQLATPEQRWALLKQIG